MRPKYVAERYIAERAVCDKYAAQLTNLAAKIPDFSRQAVNLYLRDQSASLSPTSRANHRRVILTLWRYAWEEGLIDDPPRGVTKVQVPSQAVRAWTMAECQQLVKAAGQFFSRRLRNGANLGVFLKCWVMLAYETGARYGDIFSWTAANFHGSAVGWVTSKTNTPCTRVLSQETMRLVREMLTESPDGTVLRWVCCRRQSFKYMRLLLNSCGLKSGSGKWLRRSAATHVEMTQPGKAQWFLAHRTPGLAARHYLDQSQLAGSTTGPPPLVSQ
jgi:integrase